MDVTLTEMHLQSLLTIIFDSDKTKLHKLITDF